MVWCVNRVVSLVAEFCVLYSTFLQCSFSDLDCILQGGVFCFFSFSIKPITLLDVCKMLVLAGHHNFASDGEISWTLGGIIWGPWQRI